MKKVACVLPLLLALVAGCKGSSPTAPTNPGGGNPPPGGSVNTMTIVIDGNGRVTPSDITVPVGSRVTFTNNHNRNHEMNSDPHPFHGDCPAIDQVGFLAPQQSKTTGNLTEVRVCGYHDHNDSDNVNLKGVIRVTQ